MGWDDLRYFLALARTGSVRAAGASLSVSHSTVARRVEALEEELGVRLFDRHRDGYQLTDAGRGIVPKAERIEQEVADLEREVVGQDARLEGPIRVTCTDPDVASLLIEGLVPLLEDHPGLELALDTESRNLDLSRREADVALRVIARGASPPEHLLGRRIAPVMLASYVGRDHADRLDPEMGGRAARWLGSDQPRIHDVIFPTSSYPDLPVWGAFGSMAAVLEAAAQGLGLAMVPVYVGDRHPRLQRLTKPDVRHMGDFWLLSHPDLRDNARLGAARHAITEAFQAKAALFEGRCAHGTVRPEDAPGQGDGSHLGLGRGP